MVSRVTHLEMINDGAAAASDSGTSIAELRNGGYATAFQTGS